MFPLRQVYCHGLAHLTRLPLFLHLLLEALPLPPGSAPGHLGLVLLSLLEGPPGLFPDLVFPLPLSVELVLGGGETFLVVGVIPSLLFAW